MMQKRKKIVGLTLIALVLALATTWLVSYVQARGENYYENVRLFTDVFMKISSKYVDEVDSDKMIHAAINGLLEDLDPYTQFFERKERDEMRMMQIEGEYGGLGIRIFKKSDHLIVAEPFADTPAYRAGLQAGDRIIKIEGESTAKITVDQAADRLRGRAGTQVTITIDRERWKQPRNFTLTRAKIHIPVIPFAGLFREGIGYIKLTQFSKDVAGMIRTHIRDLESQGMKALILDLRNNPGGLLEQAVAVSNQFIGGGKAVVSTKGRDKSQNHVYKAIHKPIYPEKPLIVLVNAFSASASEIVAGAIQDWDRGLVVGHTTFGKGLVQSILPLHGDNALKLTTARYYTPSGRSIQKPLQQQAAGDYPGTGDQDSTRQKIPYKTHGGRTVFGGGGIAPDLIVTPENRPRIVTELVHKGLIFDFAVAYAGQHKNLVKTFQVDNAIWEAFQQFAKKRGFSYEKESETLVADLAELAKAQSFNPKFMETLKDLKNQLEQEKGRDIERYHDKIRNLLEIEIAAALWGSEGRYSRGLRYDKAFQTAVEILITPNEYEKRLTLGSTQGQKSILQVGQGRSTVKPANSLKS